MSVAGSRAGCRLRTCGGHCAHADLACQVFAVTPVECGGDRPPRGHQALRVHRRARRRLARGSPRRDPRAAGLERVRQVHRAPAHPGPGHRGFGLRHRRRGPGGREQPRSARRPHGLRGAGRRSLPASHRARQRGPGRGRARLAARPGRRARGGAGRDGRARRGDPRSLSPRAERGAAPAGGPDAGAAARPADPSAGRAARGARSHRARGAAGPARPALRGPGQDGGAGHPRPAGAWCSTAPSRTWSSARPRRSCASSSPPRRWTLRRPRRAERCGGSRSWRPSCPRCCPRRAS